MGRCPANGTSPALSRPTLAGYAASPICAYHALVPSITFMSYSHLHLFTLAQNVFNEGSEVEILQQENVVSVGGVLGQIVNNVFTIEGYSYELHCACACSSTYPKKKKKKPLC
jgi:hypothetical protein